MNSYVAVPYQSEVVSHTSGKCGRLGTVSPDPLLAEGKSSVFSGGTYQPLGDSCPS